MYHAKLEWESENGKGRERKSVTTGISIKGLTKKKDLAYAERVANNKLNAIVKEQEEILRKKQSAALRGTASAEGLLFSDFMQMWLATKNPGNMPKNKKGIRDNTYSGYETYVNSKIAPWFRERGIYLSDLTAEDINEYYDYELENVKATSVYKYHANISAALKYAAKKGFIQSSEFILANVEHPLADQFRGQFLQQAEAKEFLNAVRGDKLEFAVLLGLVYGLRREEIIGLRWQSIDFEADCIRIEHTVTIARINKKTVIIDSDLTKTNSSRRTLPLKPVLRAKLLL